MFYFVQSVLTRVYGLLAQHLTLGFEHVLRFIRANFCELFVQLTVLLQLRVVCLSSLVAVGILYVARSHGFYKSLF